MTKCQIMEQSSDTFDSCSNANVILEANRSGIENSEEIMHTEKTVNYEMYGHGASNCSKSDKGSESAEMSDLPNRAENHDQKGNKSVASNISACVKKSGIGLSGVQTSHENDCNSTLPGHSIESLENSMNKEESECEVTVSNRVLNSTSTINDSNENQCTGTVLNSSPSSTKHKG